MSNFDNKNTEQKQLDVEGAEGSLPTADEIKNLQSFIQDEQSKNKLVLTKRQMIMMGGMLGCLFIVIIMSMSIGISNAKSSSSSSRQMEVIYYLSDNFADRKSFDVKDSPQNRAAKWIADEDALNLDTPASTKYEDAYRFVQRYALAVLYFAWKGDETWTYKFQFLSEQDECDWNYQYSTINGTDTDDDDDDGDVFELGVKCNDEGEIDYIFMPGNGLDGTIPGEIGLLLALNHLSLFNNNIQGELPVQTMYLTDLKFLAIEDNSITGSLPDWLAELTSMKFMALGNNQLTGSINDSLTSLTGLSELSLEGNKLEGDISVLNKIPSLTRLFLGSNKFTGKIDQYFLEDLIELKELDLSSNQFTGTLPHHFYNFEILDLHDNDLEGPIPSTESTDYPIQYMLLHNNGFSGKLHNNIANLESLTRLDVSNNELTGPMPESISDMTQLEYLYLANNGWTTGEIPEWHNLTGMVELSLKGTNRIGPIPEFLGREMRELKLLSLDNNNLSGGIPEQLGHMKHIEYLLLNQNDLTGTVPDTFKHMHRLKMLRLDSNMLTGSADPVCALKPKDMDIFTSDSCAVDSTFSCSCCSNCCADPNTDCDVDLGVLDNDISWKHGYPKKPSTVQRRLELSGRWRPINLIRE